MITPITTQKHPNADKLALGTVLGANVIVDLDTVSGSLGVFFPPDGQLSEAFCAAHNLIGTTVDGKRVGGFFDEKRRVKALKLRGVKSEGFWMPLSCLAFTGADLSQFKSGDEITSANGVLLCEKYISPATKRAMQQGGANRKETRGATKYFPKHFETTQYRFVKDTILNLGGVVYLTEKLHGTSQRVGNVLDKVELPLWKRVVNRLFRAEVFPQRSYKIMFGTRNVILDVHKTQDGWYGDNGFRFANHEWTDLLHKGEMVFYEIVGDCGPTTPIMPSVKIGDKDLKKQYGETMHWRYGCEAGARKVYVYRITMTNEDGVVTELSWPQVQKRAVELGLMTAPTLQVIQIVDELELANHDWIRERIAIHTEGPSTVDPSHIREGCVVRVESSNGNAWAKSKSFSFLFLESETKDADVVDTEEAS